jgi:hypothetical protein
MRWPEKGTNRLAPHATSEQADNMSNWLVKEGFLYPKMDIMNCFAELFSCLLSDRHNPSFVQICIRVVSVLLAFFLSLFQSSLELFSNAGHPRNFPALYLRVRDLASF